MRTVIAGEQVRPVIAAGLRAVRQKLHVLFDALPDDGRPDAEQVAELDGELHRLNTLANWIPGLLPESDRVRKLHRIARGLLANPDPETRGRLLVFCLRHTRDKSGLVSRVIDVLACRARQLEVPVPGDQHAGSADRQLCRNALAFIQATALARQPVSLAPGSDPLDTLRFFPGSLFGSALEDVISTVWHRLIRALAENVAASTWTLSCWCGTGGADISRQLVALAMLGGKVSLAARCRILQSRLVDLHCRRKVPDMRFLSALVEEIFCLAYPHQAAVASFPWENPASGHRAVLEQDSGLAAALQLELAAFRRTLARFLHGYHSPGEADRRNRQDLLLYTGRMQWVLLEAGLDSASDCFACCHAVLSRYWYCRQRWPERLVRLLEQLESHIDVVGPGNGIHGVRETLRMDFLALWRQESETPDTSIRLGESGFTTLGQLPALLSKSLDLLAAPGEAGLSDPDCANAKAGELMKVLSLLERGAAAVQVKAVETLCGQLLEIYGLLQEGDVPFPAALLEKAHRSLVLMLDAAASWQEPAGDLALTNEIDQWLQTCMAQHAGLNYAMDWPALSKALQSFAARLGGMLALPLRLEIRAGSQRTGSLPGETVMHTVQVLLRGLVLGISSATHERNMKHMPAVTVFALKTAKVDGRPLLILSDDSGTNVPPPTELALLEKRLPAGVSGLCCRLADGLRVFTVSLAEAET